MRTLGLGTPPQGVAVAQGTESAVASRRALYLDSADIVPSPVLKDRGLSSLAKMGGAAFAAGFHLLLPAAYVVYMIAVDAWDQDKEEESTTFFEDDDVVEARFVQLGKPLDPRKLPDRQVPILETAPSDKIPVSVDAEKDKAPAPPEKKEKPPKRATEDLIRRLGDRAQTFAEIAEKREREGDPRGIEDGTVKEAREGDLYRGLLYRFFRQGWRVPTLISDAERKDLVCTVDMSIGQNLRIESGRIVKPSKNPLFDQSVQNRIDELIGDGTPIPPPPEEVANSYIGKKIRLRFRGRDAG